MHQGKLIHGGIDLQYRIKTILKHNYFKKYCTGYQFEKILPLEVLSIKPVLLFN
jgi:hypothetical protein